VHFPINSFVVYMNAKLPFACAIILSLAGCSTTIALNKISDDSAQKVTLRDNRPAGEQPPKKESVLDPIQYFGDADFDSPPLRQLAMLVGAKLPPGQYELAVTKFRIVDVFPKRMKSTVDGARAGALMTLGISTYGAGPASGQDKITCLVSGSLGTNVINASEQVPYEASKASLVLKNDPAFKGAINECLVRLADKIAAPMRAGAL